MSQEYEIKTYGTAKVVLEAGEYTVKDLIGVIEGMGQLNRHNRALIDAVTLSSDPSGLRQRKAQPEQNTIQRLSALVRAQQITIDKLEAQPEQEPVAWFSTLPDGRLSIKIVGKPTEGNWEPLYTTPPQRKPPQFPTMLRKMWSGGEVQQWINENWK